MSAALDRVERQAKQREKAVEERAAFQVQAAREAYTQLARDGERTRSSLVSKRIPRSRYAMQQHSLEM